MNQSAAARQIMFTTTDTSLEHGQGMNETTANTIAANGV